MRAYGLNLCDSVEILEFRASQSVQQSNLLRDAAMMVCHFLEALSFVQLDIPRNAFNTWICLTKVSGTPMQDQWSSLWQHFDVRVDRPGATRPMRHTYIYSSVGFYGPETAIAYTRGINGQTFTQHVVGLILEAWRSAHEREDLGLLPILPNTRLWIKGNPSKQWGYTEKGKIIEFENATLPEPEEHYLNYNHLIPPPPENPDEEAELDELMAMPLEERVEHLSAIAQEAQRRQRIERGEEPDEPTRTRK